MKKTTLTLGVLGIAGSLMLGVVLGGAAFADILVVKTPHGVSAPKGVESEPMPTPHYNVNASGQTYGSALNAPSPDTEPDLIQVEASNGKTGYVLKVELDEANGATAVAQFRSPDEALAWQAERAGKTFTIPVYDMSGKNIVGEFSVVPADGVIER